MGALADGWRAGCRAGPRQRSREGSWRFNGTYTGPARVVRGEDQSHLVQPGDVLVCPSTNPSWTLLFGRIGALVTDQGGIWSHSAIAAREFGIPAMIGTRTATATIRDGQIVYVDGAAGTVGVAPRMGASNPGQR